LPHDTLRLLGAFQLVQNGKTVTLGQTRLEALLAALAIRPGMPIQRSRLAFSFWPDSSEKQSLTNLRKTLLTLRRRLPDPDAYILADRQHVQWRADARCVVDVVRFQEELAAAQAAERQAVVRQHLEQTVDLYTGELLPGCYDDWILPLRERLRQDFMDALDTLVDLLEQLREYAAAVRYTQRAISHDPLYEAGYLRLMRLHALQGDRARALRVYHSCVTVLRRELEVEPNEAIQAVYAQLLSQNDLPTEDRLTVAGASASGTATHLIGRQSEWNALRACWDGLKRRPVQVVMLTGEAGIGKTRLAEELINWTERQGFATARARVYAAEGGLAFAPISDWLRSQRLNDNLQRLDAAWLTEIARLLPEVLTGHPDLPAPQPFTEDWQRQRLYTALAHGLLAGNQPLLLLLDDLHWGDGETLTWLHHFLRFAQGDGVEIYPNSRLLLVCTVRDHEIDPDQPLQEWLFHLRRSQLLTEVVLTPLTEAETGVLAQNIAGVPLSPDRAAQIFAGTGGNPLFVLESMRATEDESAAERALADHQTVPMLPPNVYAMISARLGQLSPHAQEMAGLAAVIGRAFRHELLAAAGRRSEDEVVLGLEELWTRRIIQEEGSDAYDFNHDRLRDVAYAELSRARRRLLHRRVAEALSQIYPGSVGDLAGQIADHYERAGLDNTAVDHYLAAGEQALDNWAAAQAVTYFSRAQELAPDPDRSVRARFGLASARFLLGQRDEALADIDWALALLDDADHTLRPRLLYLQADLLVASAQPEMAEGSVRAALAVAERIGDQATVCQSLSLLGQLYSHRGDLDTELELIERALAISRETKNHWREARTQADLAFLHAQRGEFTRAISLAQTALTFLKTTSDRGGVAFAWNILGRAYGGMGRFDSAFAAFDSCRQVAEEIELTSMSLQIPNMLGWLHFRLGDYAGALTLDREGVAIASREDALTPEISARLNVCRDRLEVDGPQEALAELQQIEARMASGDFGYHGWRWRIRLLHIQGHCHLRLHDPQRVLTLAEEGAALARRTSARKYIALFHELAGAALAKLERWEEAASELVEATREADAIECRPIAWQARVRLARVYRALEDGQQASELLAEAGAIVSTIADEVSDDELRATFLSSSKAWFSEAEAGAFL
jgi:DNA-binding SARP family transcriptional activator